MLDFVELLAAEGVTATGLDQPFGMRLDATRLFIIDSNNHRVLIVPTTGSF